jgi:hypothetical protein
MGGPSRKWGAAGHWSVRAEAMDEDAALLRVMFLGTGEPDAPTAEAALLTGRAEWRDRTLFSHGTLAVKQGFVKRRVTFEEQWRLGAEGNTVTVVISMKTPLGLKTRTQVYVRVIEQNLSLLRSAHPNGLRGRDRRLFAGPPLLGARRLGLVAPDRPLRPARPARPSR